MQMVRINRDNPLRNVPANSADFEREIDNDVIVIDSNILNRIANDLKSSRLDSGQIQSKDAFSRREDRCSHSTVSEFGALLEPIRQVSKKL